jgi:hypothetical protein
MLSPLPPGSVSPAVCTRAVLHFVRNAAKFAFVLQSRMFNYIKVNELKVSCVRWHAER